MVPQRLTRRSLLATVVSATACALVSAACGPGAPVLPTATPKPQTPEPAAKLTPPAGVTPTAVPKVAGPTYYEAPSLTALVKQGKLPPVEERLPREPLVVTPVERVGMYGGTWRSGLLGRADRPWVSRTMAYEPLVRWDPTLTKIIPNVAKGWRVLADGREFIFFLRPGMKWSDGSPHTADDFVFWYEDIILNDDLTKIKLRWFMTGNKLGKIEKLDDYTIKMTFEQPNGLLLYNLASLSQFWVNAKYAKQFHIKYNKEAVERMVRDLKLPDWVALFQQKTDWLDNPEVPVIFPWRVTTGISQTTQLVAERNPYYWKVDTAGNQLPYIDRLVYPIVEKVETLVLKALNGEIDMMDRHIATPENKAVFVANKAKGQYDFFNVKYAWEGPVIIALNLNHKDQVLREIFRNKKFRIALSHAINRQEIIDTVYVGDGKPRQPAPLEESPHFHERLAYQYLEYDPNRANALLDEIGLKKGPDGLRLRPDGKPLFFTVDVIQAFEPWPQIMEMVTKYWKQVGVNAAVKVYERSVFYQRKAAYDHDAGVWTGADAIAAIMDPRWYMPFSNESIFGIAWADWWRSGGKVGEEPPPPAKKQQELYDQLQITTDETKQKQLMRQILDIAAEEFWAIGITQYYKGYGIVKNNFKNVPKEMWQWHLSSSPAQTNPEQYFIEQRG